MGDAFQIADVIGEAKEVAEAEHGEEFDGGFLVTDEFGFDFLQAGDAGQLDNFGNKSFGQAQTAVFRMNEDANAADMAFPPSVLLVQRGIGEDFSVRTSQEREIAFEVDLSAPILNHRKVGDLVFDKHSFLVRDGGEELVQSLLIAGIEQTHLELQTALERDALGIIFEHEIVDHKSWARLGLITEGRV